MSRRELLAAPALAAAHRAEGAQGIGRRDLVRRHNPVLRAVNPRSPLSVGNGEFAFTADITGLQSIPGAYDKAMPLCTQSQWGWHSFPIPDGMSPDDLRMEMFDTYGREVGYATSALGQEKLFNWLRENPHRLNLARIGLRLDGKPLDPSAITAIEQSLDLWTSTLTSRFQIEAAPVTVLTCCHPERDAVAARVDSPLVSSGRLTAAIEFPYGSPGMNGSDWNSPARHQTRLSHSGLRGVAIERRLDSDAYHMSC
jgi:hypothetical protein